MVALSFVCLLSLVSISNSIIATVYLDGSRFSLKKGVLDKENGVAYGSFVDSIDKTGWSNLDIRSGYGNTSVEDAAIMYAAGYLEGALTTERLYENQQNLFEFLLQNETNSTNLEKVMAFMGQQFAWTRKMIAENPSDPFWKHVGLVYSQYSGLVDGYNAYCLSDQKLDEWIFQVMVGIADLRDVQNAVAPETAPKWDEMTLDEIRHEVAISGHCSVMVKATPGYEDVIAGHSTWSLYPMMLRVFKHYSFNLKEPTTGSRIMSFSSYPGALSSIDDYYILGSGMIVMETTNDIYNNSLFKMVTPESLLSWQRIRVASQMAGDATEWTDTLARYNSGTYNNQYIVVDVNKIKLRESIEDNALRIAEQIPGLVVSDDLTPILRTGYFASYNVPFFEKIYNLSGYPEFVAKNGIEFSYQLAPRAEIFRRDENKVVDVESLGQLLRYNNYKNEEYADHSACNTICCRGDLTATPGPFGCIDTKVTNYTLAFSRMTLGVSGPTTSGGLPVFSFTGPFEKIPHKGMPITWNFTFITLEPDKDLD